MIAASRNRSGINSWIIHRCIHVAHASAVIHVLDAIDVAPVVGNTLGAEDTATGRTLHMPDRIGQGPVMATTHAALLGLAGTLLGQGNP
ncbi:hypothetical protein ABB30_06055 [Stenotrophomonas ginsengisoli]|uniref:Uncharacterized protein n=1 Tax=Stenotrophomonas ginsengisoli TaxID=336566 RepID=A0A0R0D6T5_9GAMM|nr:hypothetical protein ABB30_06055 [Stenotrophomonas ginsengisoli]